MPFPNATAAHDNLFRINLQARNRNHAPFLLTGFKANLEGCTFTTQLLCFSGKCGLANAARIQFRGAVIDMAVVWASLGLRFKQQRSGLTLSMQRVN